MVECVLFLIFFWSKVREDEKVSIQNKSGSGIIYFFFAGKSSKSKKSSSGYEEALGISTPSKEFQ